MLFGKQKGRKREIPRPAFITALILLLGALLLSVLLSVTFGNADISVREVYSVLLYRIFRLSAFSDYAEGAVHDVVWIIRFPRVILAMTIGAGLSVCGCVMQAVVKNPLADPYVLGISSGASLGATLAILFGLGTLLGSNFVGIMAFLGAMATSFAVLFISSTNGPSSASKLILAGMAVSAVCSAFSSFAVYMAHNSNATQEITFWTMGSFSNASWARVRMVLPVILAGTLIFWTQFRNLNLMLLGDETSITLGTNLTRVRNGGMILSSLMVGFSVYAAGTIGFVGMIIYVILFIFAARKLMKCLEFNLTKIIYLGILIQIPLFGVFYYSFYPHDGYIMTEWKPKQVYIQPKAVLPPKKHDFKKYYRVNRPIAEEIMPCPICGSPAKLYRVGFRGKDSQVCCTNLDGGCKLILNKDAFENEHDAVLFWNEMCRNQDLRVSTMNEIKSMIEGEE